LLTRAPIDRGIRRIEYAPDLVREPGGRWVVIEGNVGCVGGYADSSFVLETYKQATGLTGQPSFGPDLSHAVVACGQPDRCSRAAGRHRCVASTRAADGVSFKRSPHRCWTLRGHVPCRRINRVRLASLCNGRAGGRHRLACHHGVRRLPRRRNATDGAAAEHRCGWLSDLAVASVGRHRSQDAAEGDDPLIGDGLRRRSACAGIAVVFRIDRPAAHRRRHLDGVQARGRYGQLGRCGFSPPLSLGRTRDFFQALQVSVVACF
jgi:hypothetical protein